MNYLHRREDITPGIREGYRCVYRIGGVHSGEIVVRRRRPRDRETPLHFNTTPTSSAQSNDDDVDANANDSQDLVGGGGRGLEIGAPPLPPSQELSLDDILSNELEGHYDIASYSPFTNVNSPRLSDTQSSSSIGMALGCIPIVAIAIVAMFLQFIKTFIVGRLRCSTRPSLSSTDSRPNTDIQITIKTSSGSGYFALNVNVYDTVDSVQKKAQAWLELEVVPQLYFGSRKLNSRCLLFDYNVQKESTLHLTHGLRGGSEMNAGQMNAGREDDGNETTSSLEDGDSSSAPTGDEGNTSLFIFNFGDEIETILPCSLAGDDNNEGGDDGGGNDDESSTEEEEESTGGGGMVRRILDGICGALDTALCCCCDNLFPSEESPIFAAAMAKRKRTIDAERAEEALNVTKGFANALGRQGRI